MAYTLTLASGATLVIPQSSVDVNVVTNPTGLALSGVITLVGEANEGPSWSQDLANGVKPSQNSFSVGDIARVTAKYGSGRLVDAYRAAIAPSASNRIQGGPNRIILVKTNSSTIATITTEDAALKANAKRGGQSGNDIQLGINTSSAEVAPSTEQFTYIPNAAAAALRNRTNGQAQQSLSIPANTSPSALADAITAQGRLSATGGLNIGAIDTLQVSDTLEVSVLAAKTIQIKLSTPATFASAPEIGDTLHIPSGSAIAGAGNVNVGWYVVTGSTNSSTDATVTATTITGSPAAVAATPFSGTADNDLVVHSSIEIENLSGTNRNILAGLAGQNISASAVGSKLTVSLASGQVFAADPQLGDLVYIASSSVIDGGSSENVGWYIVSLTENDALSAFVELSRISNGSPASVAATAIVSEANDLACNDPQIKGFGKSMELYDGAAAANISTLFFELGTETSSAWINQLIGSSAELAKQIVTKQSFSSNDETFTVGGHIALQIGYKGTSATATVAEVSGVLRLTTSVVGGIGANLNIDLSKVATMADLVTKINSNPGYSASLASNADAQKNPSILDRSTYSIASSTDLRRPGRIKRDASEIRALSSTRVNFDALSPAGLPEDAAFAFLTGGLKGSTSSLQFSQAIDALQGVRTNFVIPLVSQDASADIAINQTEAGSTYTVDAVNAAVKSHVISMSTAKIKRHRIGVVSKRGTFIQAQASAQNMSNFRIAHLFQDVLNLNSQGEIEQFQPWMGSTVAAAMQAAGNYKSIFNKNVNISGALQAAGDFDDENLTQVEDAILAGLIPIQRQETGGFNFVTDQMTYGLDNNIIYNSMQAVYVADLMALSLAQSLQTAFVGESVADVNEGVATSFIKGKLAEFLQAKWTVSSPQQGAPSGWTSIDVKIEGSVMYVQVCVIEATTIKFIPINLNIEGIRSSSSSTGA